MSRHGRPPTAPALPAVQVVSDAGGVHLRGGQIRAVNGSTAVIRLHAEHSWILERECSLRLFATDCGAAAGNPCVVQVDPSDDYAIVSVRSAPPADGAMELRWQKDGEAFSPGRIEKGSQR